MNSSVDVNGKTFEELDFMRVRSQNNLAQLQFDRSQLDSRADADMKQRQLELGYMPVKLLKDKSDKDSQISQITMNIAAINSAIEDLQ